MVDRESLADVLTSAVTDVTAKWAKQRKDEERSSTARLHRDIKLVYYRTRMITVRDAAFFVMADAYAKASDNGTLPANARQIYYAARPRILEKTGKDELRAQYFCQGLLVDYMREYQRATRKWDVVWDDRGHFKEPHTRRAIGLGTLNVRSYLRGNTEPEMKEAGFRDARVNTHGPSGRYGAILFIEKEGFMPLFERVKLAEKYDLGIMSSKGMSVTAARQLADRICFRYRIPLFTLHDFDIAGLTIGKTVGSDTDR